MLLCFITWNFFSQAPLFLFQLFFQQFHQTFAVKKTFPVTARRRLIEASQ